MAAVLCSQISDILPRDLDSGSTRSEIFKPKLFSLICPNAVKLLEVLCWELENKAPRIAPIVQYLGSLKVEIASSSHLGMHNSEGYEVYRTGYMAHEALVALTIAQAWSLDEPNTPPCLLPASGHSRSKISVAS